MPVIGPLLLLLDLADILNWLKGCCCDGDGGTLAEVKALLGSKEGISSPLSLLSSMEENEENELLLVTFPPPDLL